MKGFLVGDFCSRATKGFAALSISSKALIFIIFVLISGAFISSQWIDTPFFLNKLGHQNLTFSLLDFKHKNRQTVQPAVTLACPARREPTNITCAANSSTAPPPPIHPASTASTCPDYFRWIYEDLKPWASTGITKQMVESAQIHAAFRIVVINGRAYVHHYHGVFQTRDSFTLWGIIQLLRRYPGQVPDLDLMFNCGDMPVISAATGGSPPPPLFRYCKDDSTVDIVFPDWSFWGWPEVNIRWWGAVGEELEKENRREEWSKREPYAFWKGNPDVAQTRGELMSCNLTKAVDWKARLFAVNWENERRQGFPSSNLAHHCKYRYNIYVEGRAWSVSQKYIMACDSPTLYVQSRFQDYVSRGLRPGRHYWPIPQAGKCEAIKQAVDWGNQKSGKVEAIGKTASSFMMEKMNMDSVYQYMLQLLTEYSKLLRYKPTRPGEGVELCVESVACPLDEKAREFLMESAEREPINSEPCAMPPPFSPQELAELLMEKANGTRKLVDALMQ